MGAPKQKWTPEEEAALKAGIAKYGLGKWSTILKDPEFSNILQARSNVDLKDKWRNINVMLNGFGSRQRGKVAVKNAKNPIPENNSLVVTTVTPQVSEVTDVKPIAVISNEEVPNPVIDVKPSSIEYFPRLDDLVLEAITKLKEPRGSSRASIAQYIEKHYPEPLNLDILGESLKGLTDKGRLIKVKHQYRIAPSSTALDLRRDSPILLLEGLKKDSSKVENGGVRILTKAQIDAELEMMRNMTPQEAAAAAAQAVAEAEAAMADAEMAARDAEDAEAEAEAARCFAEAAQKALKSNRAVRV
ncbi:OLC1v1011443C1 [Oldenlandia corymbosa var. corymbosa]|nr:OLC1v1011443C1 [Oldenlandia corymbosa var. corymbosa]